MVKSVKISIPFMAIVLIVYGCLSPGRFHQRVQKLKIGMPTEEALAILKGRPMLFEFDGLPELKIYQFKICEGEKDCEFRKLVFVNDRYAGPGKEVPDLMRENRIEKGLSRLNWAIYGAVPDAIQKSPQDGPEREFWIYNYDDSGYEMQLIVFFEDGTILNWVDAGKKEMPVFPAEQAAIPGEFVMILIQFISAFGASR